jgi:hypothetical protein
VQARITAEAIGIILRPVVRRKADLALGRRHRGARPETSREQPGRAQTSALSSPTTKGRSPSAPRPVHASARARPTARGRSTGILVAQHGPIQVNDAAGNSGRPRAATSGTRSRSATGHVVSHSLRVARAGRRRGPVRRQYSSLRTKSLAREPGRCRSPSWVSEPVEGLGETRRLSARTAWYATRGDWRAWARAAVPSAPAPRRCRAARGRGRPRSKYKQDRAKAVRAQGLNLPSPRSYGGRIWRRWPADRSPRITGSAPISPIPSPRASDGGAAT